MIRGEIENNDEARRLWCFGSSNGMRELRLHGLGRPDIRLMWD
jgi:hypothetical protein